MALNSPEGGLFPGHRGRYALGNSNFAALESAKNIDFWGSL